MGRTLLRFKRSAVKLYDITQCENQRESYQWRMTLDGETVAWASGRSKSTEQTGSAYTLTRIDH